MSILISSEKEKLDIDFIYQFLKSSYWGKNRTNEEVKISIENSMCFGIYLDNQQIGFARIVTDYIFFAYLMDVFIAKEHQRKGHFKQLMKAILEHQKLQNIKKWMLATKDAHTLYSQFDFKPIDNPLLFMTKSIIN